ncbi:hypothetical protein A2U01_0050850, partial [Trifolium medium]|nr:hypothetical protein [Trifolium medium]
MFVVVSLMSWSILTARFLNNILNNKWIKLSFLAIDDVGTAEDARDLEQNTIGIESGVAIEKIVDG